MWYCSAAAVIVIFTGAAYLFSHTNGWEFSWDSILRRPVAVINGEPIARSEARERFRVTRLMLEKEYGKELFAGERGRGYLGELERDIMEQMIAEGLVQEGLQVARDVYERYAAAGMLYNHIECSEHYFRPLDIWAALFALQGLVYDRAMGALEIGRASCRERV